MNYTSTRYDAPFNGGRSAVPLNGRPTHSANSSISSSDGKGSGSSSSNGNLAGVGTHGASSSNGSTGTPGGLAYPFDAPMMDSDRFGGPSSRMGAGGLPTRSNGLQNISQGLREQASANYAHQQQHRRAQNSEDYDGSTQQQYAQYGSSYHREAGNSSLMPSTARMDREHDGDASFDYLLSPALAPVGPISSLGASQAPPPRHAPPPLPHSNSYMPGAPSARPVFNRSQTAIPASSASGRAYQAPAYQQPPSDTSSQTTSSHHAASSGQGSSSQRDYTPPPAISAATLLDMVLKMRGDAMPTLSALMSSSSMARSQSANAAPKGMPGVQQSGMSGSSTHTRNISNGSNKSDEEQGLGSAGMQTGLVPPAPSLARTTSSKNVNESAATPPGSGLETVVLSHQRVAEVPDEVIDVLAGTVGRLALSYNYIANLPPSFSKLGSTLRYLNIRLNMFTTFPPVLCEMPSLEILDISRNKIKRLPAQCGSLKNLRVFSISKNRVKRLPTYFADMKVLRVLKLDHNPLEWPPREVVAQPAIGSASEGTGLRQDGSGTKLDEAQALSKWLSGLQDWIREHADEVPALPPLQSSNSEEKLTRDRSRSDLASTTESQSTISPASAVPMSGSAIAVSASSTDEEATSPGHLHAQKSPRDHDVSEHDSSRMSQHGRNASHSLATAAASSKRGLRPKKSLPDLRQNHAQILDERFNDGGIPEESETESFQALKARPAFKHSKTSSSSSLSPLSARPALGIPTPPRSANSDKAPSSIPTLGDSIAGDDELGPLSNQFARSRRAFDKAPTNGNQLKVERGSSGAYFRRLSMLPAFTISKAVPPSLLQFIDAIRGILFSLSQVHASIKQCVVFPAPDRLPANVSKLMASGEDCMGFLVDSLDRFDGNSRRGSPDTAVVKDVIETCRENVITFGKLVSVFVPQISMLFGQSTDVRYTRTLIISIYGAMGEIATSWAALTPLKDEIVGWMRGDAELSPTSQPSNPSTNEHFQPSHASSGSLEQAAALQGNRPLPSPALTPTGTPLNLQRQAALAGARRHAGSFTNYNPRFG